MVAQSFRIYSLRCPNILSWHSLHADTNRVDLHLSDADIRIAHYPDRLGPLGKIRRAFYKINLA